MFLRTVRPLLHRGLTSKASSATELASSFLTDLRHLVGDDQVATGGTVRAQHGQANRKSAKSVQLKKKTEQIKKTRSGRGSSHRGGSAGRGLARHKGPGGVIWRDLDENP